MAIRHFHDFVLLADDVRRKAGNGVVEGFTVRVLDSPVGQGERKEQVTVPDFSQQLRFLEDRTYDNKVEKQIELGQTLADLLLPSYARTLFRQSLRRIGDDEGLRLRLRLDDALVDFPWEYMYIQETRGEKVSSSFLALDSQISIVRHEVLALPADGFDLPGDFHEAPAQRRVVVAMAAPPGYPPLTGLPGEQKAIREALATLLGIETTYVPEYTAEHYDRIPSAKLEDVFSALRQRTDIFHFSGHGEFAARMGPVLGSRVGAGGIVLASAAGDALPVAADRFAETLRGKGVRLVVLGACQTARRDGRNVWSGVAPALLRVGIPAVVAMQFKIRDDVAASFIGTMYQALVEGREIDEGVALGRAAIRIKALGSTQPDLRDWGVPVLYLRSTRGTVFRPVSDASALQKAAASLAPVIQHQKQGAPGGLTIVGGQHHYNIFFGASKEGTGAIRVDPNDVQMPIESQVDLALWSRTDLQSTPETDLRIVADENEKIWEYFVTEEAYNTRLVELRHFSVMEYFPISPGTYHTPVAKGVREEAERHKLTDYQPADSGKPAETEQTAYDVYGKAYMLRGGIGAVRLNPCEFFGELHYFMTASSNGICHQGFPILVPLRFYRMLKSRINREGGAPATLKGAMKYVEMLPTIFGSDRRIPRLFLFVTEPPEMERHHRLQVQQDGHVVSVAVSFFGTSKGRQNFYSAYVTFNPADDVDRRRSCEWLERDYIKGRYQGEVVTDFDEVRTQFPDARFGLPVVMSGRLDVDRALEFLKSKGSWVGPADQRFVNAYYQSRVN